MAINGAHTIIYAADADLTRAFFRDVLEWPFVDEGGWPIYRQPPSELACTQSVRTRRHELFLLCDDVHVTVAELRAKGVEFEGDVSDQGWGLLISMLVPGAGKIGLYQPRHAPPPA